MAGTTLLVGLDGTEQGDKVLAFAKEQARLIGQCAIVICYVIEWSPFAFQTPEENETRHARREEELRLAHERIVDPAVRATQADGLDATGLVRHGHAADVLEQGAREHGASQIVVGRVSARSLKEHFFGSVSARLASSSSVPVTIVP